MPALSRLQAETLLRVARAERPLYDDLRPAYLRLDPLVALLRRRGFSGLMYAAGRPGEAALWFDCGRLHGAWVLPAGAGDVLLQQEDPLAALRLVWADPDALVSVHPGSAPPLGAAADAALRGAEEKDGRGAPADGRAAGGGAGLVARLRGLPTPRVAAGGEGSGRSPGAVPWERLLPEALARVRRHRGSPLALQLEEAANAAMAPHATASGGAIHGRLSPEQGAAALRRVAEGLRRVAGSAFTERLLLTLARDFACEDAVKQILQSAAQGD
ncbi:MAG: hypothetical protein RB148_07555 [Armatimonadota bacterium]|nr:hypothetical protein [Armatimonadota bacterium]MDR7464302.1 hypothetical protein [Armatimonadota bacterium]MDR7470950.1 hypothetical protein [Armatimonadota bacterium]